MVQALQLTTKSSSHLLSEFKISLAYEALSQSGGELRESWEIGQFVKSFLCLYRI